MLKTVSKHCPRRNSKHHAHFNIELVGVRGSDDDNRRVTAAVTKRRGRVRPPPGDGKLLFERSAKKFKKKISAKKKFYKGFTVKPKKHLRPHWTTPGP